MENLDKLKEDNPEMYMKIMHLAANIDNLPRREKRATQRKILKLLNTKKS